MKIKWLRSVCSEHTGVVQLLLEHGADINAKANGGMTPLYIAARNGNCLNSCFKSITHKWLWFVCNSGNKDVVEFLIEHGANVIARNDDGETPRDKNKIFGWKYAISLCN